MIGDLELRIKTLITIRQKIQAYLSRGMEADFSGTRAHGGNRNPPSALFSGRIRRPFLLIFFDGTRNRFQKIHVQKTSCLSNVIVFR